VSKYRDELDAARNRAAALEEDIEAHEEAIEERDAKIAELEGQLAEKAAEAAAPARKKKRRRSEEEDEADAPLVRRQLVPLQPKGQGSIGAGMALLVLLLVLGAVVLIAAAG
jgi:hypothetical protein